MWCTVVFQRFQGTTKVIPNNRAMAACPNGQLVVRYIKDLPSKCTNLIEPKSSLLEELVRRVEQQVPKVARQHGAEGFHALLQASLTVGAQSCDRRRGGLCTYCWFHRAAVPCRPESVYWHHACHKRSDVSGGAACTGSACMHACVRLKSDCRTAPRS